ncbi:unnamed protein product [Caenorhabditis brenneri]
MSWNSSLLAGTVHFDPAYINYTFEWKQFPILFATIPWIYMIPSFIVICEISSVYLQSNWRKSEPGKNQHINTNLVRYGVPLIFIFPICFTFYLIPALGVCKQRAAPYPFGAVWIYYINSAFGLRNSFFHLYNLIFWMTCSVLANMLLFYQVGRARARLIRAQTSGASMKAHTSITITTLAMITFYVTNGAFLLMYIFYYGTNSYFSYAEIIRPFGNDLQTCVVTWVFYLTHPAFRKSTQDSDMNKLLIPFTAAKPRVFWRCDVEFWTFLELHLHLQCSFPRFVMDDIVASFLHDGVKRHV